MNNYKTNLMSVCKLTEQYFAPGDTNVFAGPFWGRNYIATGWNAPCSTRTDRLPYLPVGRAGTGRLGSESERERRRQREQENLSGLKAIEALPKLKPGLADSRVSSNTTDRTAQLGAIRTRIPSTRRD
jgi:hypothetical protein